MITAVPHPDDPLPSRLKWRSPEVRRVMTWVDEHSAEDRLYSLLADFTHKDYATLVRFLTWAMDYHALARRRKQPEALDTDDAHALKLAAKDWLYFQTRRNRELFDLMLRHADLQPVYVFVAWALSAGRLKDADSTHLSSYGKY